MTAHAQPRPPVSLAVTMSLFVSAPRGQPSAVHLEPWPKRTTAGFLVSLILKERPLAAR